MSNPPLVSIIIPTYNRADILRNALDSALGQTYTNTQIIVVDDGSTDSTAELVKQYPKVEYILQKHAGQAAARNCGLWHSKGSVIASLDSDDIWNPDFLMRCVTKLEEDKLDFVFTNWLQYTDEHNGWDYLVNDPYLKPHMKDTPDHWVTLSYTDARKLYMYSCPSPSSAVVIRKSSIVSGWDEQILIGDDWCMYINVLLSKERKIAFTLDKLWKKRVNFKNIYDGRKRSEVLKYLYITDAERMIEKFKNLLTAEELYIFQRRYIASLVELAKHEIVREFNWGESMKLLKKSFALDSSYTLKMIPQIILTGVNRKINPSTAR
jgi:glycosyltransferase involved in cell wall biosynthesis